MSITELLAKKLTNYNNTESAGSKFRAKRIAPLTRLVESIYAEKGEVKIIDVGGTKAYWNIVSPEFLEKHKVHITIVNIPGSKLPESDARFKFVHGDGCNLEHYQDHHFDIVHSNSVIEHVGGWKQMTAFAKECKRLAKYYFIQTPSFWFPVEPHFMVPFFHWLPKPVRIWLVQKLALGHFNKAPTVDKAVRTIESVQLLDKAMFHSLFDDSNIITEKVLLLPKSNIAVRS